MCEDFVRNASKKELNTINLFGIKLKVRPYLTPQNIKKNIINFIDEHLMFHKPFDGDVDIVFLWCSNQDPAWNEKRIATLKSLNKDFVEQAVCDGRFQDNEKIHTCHYFSKYQ